MRVKVLEIAWHARVGGRNDPVLSLDIHPTLNVLATAGADEEVKLWKIDRQSNDNINIIFICSLQGHAGTVNVVRFSPDGTTLASGADDSTIFLWTPKSGFEWMTLKSETDCTRNLLRGHASDVYDISWAPDTRQLVSGSVDNCAIVWNISKACARQTLKDHNHFVQGVAWDPLGDYIGTQSCDRSMRVYSVIVSKQAVKAAEAAAIRNESGNNDTKDTKLSIPEPPAKPLPFSLRATSRYFAKEEGKLEESDGHGSTKQPSSKTRLFMDETVPSFFRRLAWSPDGTLLIAPAGQSVQPSDTKNHEPAVHIYARHFFEQPAVQLVGLPSAALVIRPSPILYKLRKTKMSAKPIFDFPYRCIFAVATLESVILYDTEQPMPIAAVSNVHFEKLTDIAWSFDGSTLMISSLDGYCSVVAFDENELGEALPEAEQPKQLRRTRKAARQGSTRQGRGRPKQKQSVPSNEESDTINRTVQHESKKARITPTLVQPYSVDSSGQSSENQVATSSSHTTEHACTLSTSNASSETHCENRTEVTTADTNKPKRKRIAPMLVAS